MPRAAMLASSTRRSLWLKYSHHRNLDSHPRNPYSHPAGILIHIRRNMQTALRGALRFRPC
jgi:hypothetical protein